MARELFEVVLPAAVLVVASMVLGWSVAAAMRRRGRQIEQEAQAELDRHMHLEAEAFQAGNFEKAEFHNEQASLALDRVLGLPRRENR